MMMKLIAIMLCFMAVDVTSVNQKNRMSTKNRYELQRKLTTNRMDTLKEADSDSSWAALWDEAGICHEDFSDSAKRLRDSQALEELKTRFTSLRELYSSHRRYSDSSDEVDLFRDYKGIFQKLWNWQCEYIGFKGKIDETVATERYANTMKYRHVPAYTKIITSIEEHELTELLKAENIDPNKLDAATDKLEYRDQLQARYEALKELCRSRDDALWFKKAWRFYCEEDLRFEGTKPNDTIFRLLCGTENDVDTCNDILTELEGQQYRRARRKLRERFDALKLYDSDHKYNVFEKEWSEYCDGNGFETIERFHAACDTMTDNEFDTCNDGLEIMAEEAFTDSSDSVLEWDDGSGAWRVFSESSSDDSEESRQARRKKLRTRFDALKEEHRKKYLIFRFYFEKYRDDHRFQTIKEFQCACDTMTDRRIAVCSNALTKMGEEISIEWDDNREVWIAKK